MSAPAQGSNLVQTPNPKSQYDLRPYKQLTSVPRASTRMLAPIASLTSMLSVGFSSQLRAVNAYGLLVSAPTYSSSDQRLNEARFCTAMTQALRCGQPYEACLSLSQPGTSHMGAAYCGQMPRQGCAQTRCTKLRQAGPNLVQLPAPSRSQSAAVRGMAQAHSSVRPKQRPDSATTATRVLPRGRIWRCKPFLCGIPLDLLCQRAPGTGR